jgi:hypothetical protein
MNNFLAFFDKNFAPRLGNAAADYRKIIEMLLAKRKQNYLLIINGTASQDSKGQPIYPLAVIMDAFLNIPNIDGKLIVVDTDTSDFETLTKYTSDKTVLVNEELVNVLHGLASNPNAEIDLLFMGTSNNDLDARGTTIPKNLKTMPAIDDALSTHSMLVIDSNQQVSPLASDIQTCVEDFDKKCFLANSLQGWVW